MFAEILCCNAWLCSKRDFPIVDVLWLAEVVLQAARFGVARVYLLLRCIVFFAGSNLPTTLVLDGLWQ